MSETKQITLEWLQSLGFTKDEFFGMHKDVASGPDDTQVTVCVGTYPNNEPCVSIVIAGFGIVLRDLNRATIEQVLKLLEGCYIDHPDIADVDLSELE